MIIIVIVVDFGIRYVGKIDTVTIIIASFYSGRSINNMNKHGIAVMRVDTARKPISIIFCIPYVCIRV